MKRIANGGACPQVDSTGNIFAIAGAFIKKYDSAGTLLNTSANIGTNIAASRLAVSSVSGKCWVICGSALYLLDTDLTTLQTIALPAFAGILALDLAIDPESRGGAYTVDRCWVVCQGSSNISKAFCYATDGTLKVTITFTGTGYISYDAYLCAVGTDGSFYAYISGRTTGGSSVTLMGMYSYSGAIIQAPITIGKHKVTDFEYRYGDAACFLAASSSIYFNANLYEWAWSQIKGSGSTVGIDKTTNNRIAASDSVGGVITLTSASSGAIWTTSSPNGYTHTLKVTSHVDGNNVHKNIVWNAVSNQWITWTSSSDLDHCDLIFLSELSTPTMAPAGGLIAGPTNVAISIVEGDADIRYTEDGSTPTSASPIYGAPITVATTETIKAIGTGTDYLVSQVASETYTAVVSNPVISPSAGTKTNNVSVSIICSTVGANIYYTTDGSTPDATKTLYTGAFTLYASATVKAIGILTGFVDSSVVSSAYVIVIPNITDLVLSRSEKYSVSVQWTNPVSFSSIVVRRKTTGNPTSATDGDLVYSGTDNNFIDTVGYATYYYGVFVSNSVYYGTGVFDNINIPTPNKNIAIVLSSPNNFQQNNEFFQRLKKNLMDEQTYARGQNAVGYTDQMIICEGNSEIYVTLNVFINNKINQQIESDKNGNFRFGIKLQLGKNNIHVEYA